MAEVSEGPWRTWSKRPLAEFASTGDEVEDADLPGRVGTVLERVGKRYRVRWSEGDHAGSTVPELVATDAVRVLRPEQVFTSARSCVVGAHELLRVWVRGALAGELTVGKGEAEAVATALGLESDEPKSNGE
jgi:hypothetical protein